MKKSGHGGLKFNMYWMYAIIGIVLVGLYYVQDNSINKEISWTQFGQYVKKGGVKKMIVYDKSKVEGFLTDSMATKAFHKNEFTAGSGVDAKVSANIPSSDAMEKEIDNWRASGVFKGDVKYEKGSDYSSLLWSFGPIILLIVFWFVIMKKMSNRDGGGGAGGVF
ncbi:MAG: ATP-dependent metallopeptidase FtsH/Yme1/Tma family protein, partial [Muribaculaceae bacterium]